MNTVRFTVPNGFRYEHTEIIMNLDKAADMLITKRQRRFTAAIRQENKCLLIQDRVYCPCCGHRTLAYDRYMTGGQYGGSSRIQAGEIRSWATNLSLFAEDDRLDIQSATNGFAWFTCPRCSMTSSDDQSDSAVEISVISRQVRFTLLNISKDISAYLLLAAARGIRLCFPLQETVMFNMGKGRVILSLEDSAGHTLQIRDITEPNEYWRQSTVYRLLCFSTLARRKLAQAFSSLWSAPLPFTRDELAMPELFLSLTQFWNHNRTFFDGLPLDETGAIDRSFRRISHRIHNSQDLPALYDEAGLPQKKSLRRIIFETPNLFWLLPEISLFMKLLGGQEYQGQINYCQILLERVRLQNGLLFFLHFYPSAEIFFRDFAKLKGAKALLTMLTHFSGSEKLMTYATRYSAASMYQRRREQSEWRDIRSIITSENAATYLPVSVGLRFRDRIIDGYRFVWLRRSRSDFKRAGRALNNCLVSYTPEAMRVVVIRKGQETLAAVEVRNERIIQALGPCNVSLDEDSKVWQVLVQWATDCRFIFAIPKGDDDLNDLLPF